MKIKILTDASAEIPKPLQKELNIISLDMPVNYEDKEILDINMQEFWKLQLAGKRMKTSQPSRERMLEEFTKAKEEGYALICIFLSSALSGTFETAKGAKNEVGYDNIYLIDSLSVTVGEQLLVLKARILIDKGLQIAEIVQELERYKKRVRIYASVDSLKYLALGGRLNGTVALMGNLLNLKPIITINGNGEVKVVSKKMGLNKTIMEICDIIKNDLIDLEEPIVPIFAYSVKNVYKFIDRFKSKENETIISAPIEIGHVI
ncbi:MAG: DegV family protein, partial [Ruminococcus sp.]